MYPKPIFTIYTQKVQDGETGKLLNLAAETFLGCPGINALDPEYLPAISPDIRQTALIGPVALERRWVRTDTWIARNPEGELWLMLNPPRIPDLVWHV